MSELNNAGAGTSGNIANMKIKQPWYDSLHGVCYRYAGVAKIVLFILGTIALVKYIV